MANIVVIGSSNTDMVVKTPRFPLPGETLMGGMFYMFAGGKGAGGSARGRNDPDHPGEGP